MVLVPDKRRRLRYVVPARRNASPVPTVKREAMSPLQLEYLPQLPKNLGMPIGCIGSGFIMSD
jgi:hypothetical protein